jgi:N-acetylglucosaminyldiphosphoundecaprenol N-acetyl-beta-D-mannosaminyltransferase
VVNTVELFDIPFSNVAFDELCACVDDRIESREPGYITTPNVDHICRFHRHEAFREAYLGAWLIVVDGAPVIWASRALGVPLKRKLSGSDLVVLLSEHAARRGYSVYLFGAAEGVAEEAAANLRRQFAGLNIVGVYSPPLGFYNDEEMNAAVIHRICDAAPDICFVALGAPQQELWMHKHCRACGVPVMLGIGGGFDFVSGRVRRAPVWMQNAGLEWVWRLCQEPRRLWRRYLVDDAYIVVLFARELWRRITRRRRPSH